MSEQNQARCPLPFEPELLTERCARYGQAVEQVYASEDLAADRIVPRPGQQRRHVFDAPSGLRLIITRERFEHGKVGVHMSASVSAAGDLATNLKRVPIHERIEIFIRVSLAEWAQIARVDSMPAEFVGLSKMLIPHFIVWTPEAKA